MSLFSRDDLKVLMDGSEGPCVSIYQPTHRPAAHTEQDPIRFKNLLRQAEEQLVAGGLRGPEARELLKPGWALHDDSRFWQHQSDGLAVFLARGMARHYCLPHAFEELLVVGARFHIKPLVPLLNGDGRFYVLAVSQKSLRLFRGTRFRIDPVEVGDLPKSLVEALQEDELEKQLQFHTRAPEANGGRRAAMFHGHGQAQGEDPKDRILRYFRIIDAGLHDVLRNGHAPLVLAGVEYYFPIYREANTYPHLVEGGVPGNPEGLRPEELHRQAWEVVRPRFEKAHQEARARYRQLAGTGRASASLEEVLVAARQGRVETLLVSPGVHLWGTFDAEQGRVQLHDEPAVGDEDLLDRAVLETLGNSGQVFPEERSQLPNGSALAAVFRY